jgi:hypothetical protein
MHRIRLRVGCFSVLPVLFLALASFVLPHPTNADAPRRGGVLLAAIGADPTSLDPHQESTFATIQLVAPPYSTRVLSPLTGLKFVGGLMIQARRSSGTSREARRIGAALSILRSTTCSSGRHGPWILPSARSS